VVITKRSPRGHGVTETHGENQPASGRRLQLDTKSYIFAETDSGRPALCAVERT
jgi:hypothetical protein